MDIYNMKCIIVGESNSGKTSLVKRIIMDKYIMAQHTIGVDFSSKNVIFGDKMYNISFWDISGRERLSVSCHTLFKNANVAWICFDLNNPKSLQNTIIWKQEIEKIARIPFILVGCKSDKTAIDENELVAFARNNKFDSLVITSSKKTRNVNELVEITCSVMKNEYEPVEKFESIPLMLETNVVEKPNNCCFC
jgi:small GTP-binding protein